MATGLLNQGGYSLNLNEIHDTLIEIAYKAGDIINGALPTTGATGSKKNSK
jgi:myo-inositol-1(or 4)-monophosphatase